MMYSIMCGIKTETMSTDDLRKYCSSFELVLHNKDSTCINTDKDDHFSETGKLSYQLETMLALHTLQCIYEQLVLERSNPPSFLTLFNNNLNSLQWYDTAQNYRILLCGLTFVPI
jgi:hypothetical protein